MKPQPKWATPGVGLPRRRALVLRFPRTASEREAARQRAQRLDWLDVAMIGFLVGVILLAGAL